MTIIAWGGDLDRIWPTTILATTAAASGMESSVFFTFWGLVRDREAGRAHHRRQLDAEDDVGDEPGLRAEGEAQPQYQFAGAGPAMFKKLADDHQVAKPEELIADWRRTSACG